jgi:hypothetical protein
MTSGQKTPHGGSIDYDALIRSALIGVVRDVLMETAKNGLMGSHHFYLAFSTTHPRVEMPEYLRALHPRDMTIVLQNQFWDLAVDEGSFSVNLSFNGKAERLYIPFDALLGFRDPSVEFALQFYEVRAPGEQAPAPAPEVEQDTAAEAVADAEGDNVIALDVFRKQ